MILTAGTGTVRLARRIRFLALALVGLLVGHQAVYLVEYGNRYSDVMARTGHGYWLDYALLVLVVAGVPIGVSLIGLARLRTRLHRSLGSTAPIRSAGPIRSSMRVVPPVDRGSSYVGEFLSLMPRLLAVVLVGFVVQENLEAVSIGHPLVGLGVLNDLMTLQILIAITALISVAGAWLRWRESVLTYRLRTIREALAHANMQPASSNARYWTEIAATIAHRWLLARRIAGRAPPIVGAAA